MEAPPFRVLSPGGRIPYEQHHLPGSLQPPPSRAPEPYKITPLSTSYGRSHRTSSFAIIAEPRPPSPAGINQQDLDSQALGSSRPGSGRVSPFRGRGFKGPPPRARSRSRPRSPDSRRGSLSNQNSPKRSQIPRPATVRNKENGFARKPSPKFGRRAANNNNNNNANSNSYTSSIVASKNANNRNNNVNNNRRQPIQRESKLSPIQGSPANKNNKIVKSASSTRANGSIPQAGRGGPNHQRYDRNHLAPPRPQLGGKRFITANSTTSQQTSSQRNNNSNSNKASNNPNDSPSRIPRRQGLGNGNSDSTTSLSSKQLEPQATANANANSAADAANRNGVVGMENSRQQQQQQQTSKKKPAGGGSGEEDLGLVDLLKQSSGATGTSSVVNTTTTTAVQPLHIDAASILAEGELVAKLTSLEKKQKSQEAAEGKSGSGRDVNNADGNKTNNNNNNGSSKGKNGSLTQTMIKHFGDDAANNNNNNSNKNEASSNQAVESRQQDVVVEDNETQRNAPSSMSSHKKTDSKSSIAQSSSKSTTSTNESKKLSPLGSRTDDKLTVEADGGSGNKRTTRETLGAESDSLGSLHSTDTGVSVNTVKGLSSAKEKTGLHVVKNTDEIETLSGNIVRLENSTERQGATGGAKPKPGTKGPNRKKPTAAARWKRLKLGSKFVSSTASSSNKTRAAAAAAAKKKVTTTTTPTTAAGGGSNTGGPSGGGNNSNKNNKKNGKKSNRLAGCWPKMRCLALKRESKGQPWPGKGRQTASTLQLTLDSPDQVKQTGIKPGRWARIKEACKCVKLRTRLGGRGRVRRGAQAAQVAPAEMPSRRTGCCPGGADRRLGGLCRGLFSRCSGAFGSCWTKCCSCKCISCSCCKLPSCCKRADKPKAKAKHSVGSIAPPPVSEDNRPKLPDVLIEHNSIMHGAIPCLPVPLAWFCLICNFLLPGTGSVLSGLFNLCTGQPRFSATASPRARFGAFIVNTIVGVSQLFTVLFCLVGWGWSIWWGVTMIRVAKKYKRFKESEAAANDPEAGVSLPAPGVAVAGGGGSERPK